MQKTFLFYQKAKAKADDFVVIKDGFCWLAFIFGVVWALFNKLWKIALLVFAVHYLANLSFEMGKINHIENSIITFSIMLFFGFEAVNMQIKKLENRGYKFADVVVDRSKNDAIKKFLERKI